MNPKQVHATIKRPKGVQMVVLDDNSKYLNTLTFLRFNNKNIKGDEKNE